MSRRDELALEYHKKKFRDLCPDLRRIIMTVVKAEEEERKWKQEKS